MDDNRDVVQNLLAQGDFAGAMAALAIPPDLPGEGLDIAERVRPLTSDDIRGWSKLHADRTISFDTRRLPRPVSTTIHEVGEGGEVSQHELRLVDELPQVYAIPRASLPAGVGLISTDDDKALYVGPHWSQPKQAIFGVYGELASDHASGRAITQRFDVRYALDEAMYVMFGSKYFGANLASLMNVALLREAVGDARIPFVTHAKCAPGPFELQAIRRMGFRDNQIIPVGDAPTMRVERLWTAHMPLRWERKKVTVSSVAADLFRQHLGVPSAVDWRTAEKIYITRRDADRRRILNEDEVIKLLEKYGFKTVECTPLDLEQRLDTFKNAGVILGPLGSNMAHALFAPGGAWVLEFVPTFYDLQPEVRDTIAGFAFANGQRYLRVPCEIQPSEDRRYTEWNLLIPLDKLKTALDFAMDQYG